jgi:hypothetical protein
MLLEIFCVELCKERNGVKNAMVEMLGNMQRNEKIDFATEFSIDFRPCGLNICSHGPWKVSCPRFLILLSRLFQR